MSKRGFLSRPSLRLSSSRRRFLQLSTAAMTGVVLSNCARNIGGTSESPDATASSPSSGSDTLYVYGWSAYFNDDVLAEFEEMTGISVIADIYDSNETMLAKLQAGGGNQYSIIYPSDYMVEQMIEMDMLLAIDQERVPDLADLLPQWQSPPYDPNNEFSLPYTWGTTGLVYNAAELGEDITDWDFLWDNKNDLSRKVTLLNDVREVAGFALKMLGYSNTSTDPEEIEAAFKKLEELKPAISAFTTDGWRDRIIPGDLLVSHAYSVDALDVVLQNPDLKYVVPASGATVWTDTIAIPKTAPNVEAAYAWIDFVSNPETAAKVSNSLKLATPNQKTLALLDTDLKSDERLFPPDAVLEKCEPLGNVGDTIDLYDRLWTQLTST